QRGRRRVAARRRRQSRRPGLRPLLPGRSLGAMNGPTGHVAEDDEGRASFERKNDPSRVVALSDGVFAIILTLLVLDVHVPRLTADAPLTTVLHKMHPSLITFAISFIL